VTLPEPGARREQESVHFVLDLGRALHQLGHPSHWLEEGLGHASRKLGLVGQFFTTPTSVFAAFGDQEHQRTYLIRVEPGGVQLERLAQAIATGRAVLAGRMTAAEGSARLQAILLSPARYGRLLTTCAFALSGAAACRFLGGGLVEVISAALLGAVLSLLSMLATQVPTLSRLFEPFAAFVISAIATALAREFPLSVYVTTLSAILILLPGLTVTAAMAELSNQHLVSGTARLTGAGMSFLGLAFGVAMGSRVVGLVAGMPPHVTPMPLPAWTEYLALAIAPLAFTVLLRARPRDIPWIAATGTAAFFAGRLTTPALGPELGAFLGAFVAAALSNRISRRRGGSPATTLVPAILLLVPGSVGFRSLTLLLNRDVLSGVEAAFRMLIMIAALVSGLLFASILSPAPSLAEEPREPEDPRD